MKAVTKQSSIKEKSVTHEDDEDMTYSLIEKIAMDIGKETVAYIEVMYPEAIQATSSTFKLSVRNHIYNEIMDAIDTRDENKVIERLERRKIHRRKWLKTYRDIRRKKNKK